VSYVIRAEWTIADGNTEAVLKALDELVPLTRAEPGNQIYLPYHDPAHPEVVHLFEVYDDEAAFQAHIDSAHFQHHVLGTVVPLLSARSRAVFRTFDQER
jgi:quinol monooxygenase YgiN